MTTELTWKFSMISIRILVASLIIQQFEDYEILRELDDQRILLQIFLNLIRLVPGLEEHRITMKIFNDFNQNSAGQPNYSTI
jgi:hypothetical protein